MINFEVMDMTCGHCVSVIANALKAVDEHAKFNMDQSKHLVSIESNSASPKEFQDAIANAGYTPVPVYDDLVTAPASANACCCGSKK